MPASATEGPHSDDEFEEALEATDSEEADIDFSDIELPDSLHFALGQWSDDRYDVLRGARGTVYEGRTHRGRKAGPGKLWDAERKQYIDGEWKDDRLVALNFAQFQINDSDYFRLNGLDDLITSNKNHFVARITKQPLNILCDHFPNFRRQIESKITITKILDDDLKNYLQICREQFESTLRAKQTSVTKSRKAQRDMFHLFLLKNEMENNFDYEDENENMVVLRKIMDNNLFLQELRNGARDAREVEQNAYQRNRSLPLMQLTGISFSWKNVIKECINDSIRNINIALQQALPSRNFIRSGLEDIMKLKTHNLFTCSVHDIQLFSDLEFTILQHSKSAVIVSNFRDFTEKYVTKLWKLLITKINNSGATDIPKKSVYTNSVFLQLVKTFLELLDISCRQYGQEIKYIVNIQANGNLQMTECPERNLGILENRLNFLLKLMNHFKPGDVKNYNFDYKFYFFKVKKHWLNGLAFDNSLANIDQEYIIWLYYIHMSFCVDQDQDKDELFYFLNCLMDLFKTVISNNVSLEKIRILANSVIKFGNTITPYFLDETSLNVQDINLLLKQAEYIKDFVTNNENAQADITNIVDIYQVFWDERKNLFTEIRRIYSHGLSSTNKLITTFNKFIEHVFTMKIHSNKFLTFLRSCNEFVRLLRGTSFPWYIKANNLVSASSKLCVELVDADKQSFLVNKIEDFLGEFRNYSPPRHYLLDVAIHFIECTQKFMNLNKWNVNDKIQASSDLLLLMGRSFISFKKLPNAVDYDKFFSDFTEPFERVTKNSVNINDFKKRLGSLESYYKYTIALNEMSASKALELCRQNISSCHTQIDYSFDSSILESSYKIYLDKFNTYVQEDILQANFNINKLTKKIKSKVKPFDINKWDSNYKQTKLPKLLAGLSAVWSALESKDIICQKKVIKPHCIQILCILRLLGVDQNQPCFASQLAQVLTGQGKSIVLSLLAAALALTGNRVRVVCYNKYLADRDKKDFQTFYKAFNIADTIKYGIFDDMANEILEPTIKGKKYDLRELVIKLTTNELEQLYVKNEKNSTAKTVLLIDEVDVFFSPEFYGNTYNIMAKIESEALGDLQIKIWNLTESTCNKSHITENIQKYIDEMYTLSTDSTFKNIVRDSRTLLNTHIDEMINNAVEVRSNSASKWYSKKFKLRDDGRIVTINGRGEHRTTTHYRYNNVFMYFKLKRNDYDHMSFQNYGYLNVRSGSVSYAILPKDYHSILGVTGTLKQLSDVEMRAVTSYISRGSDMPTFFGRSKLRVISFSIEDSVDAWTTAILNSILSYVQEERAVIVFFEDEQIIDTLRDKFASHLSQYSVLTGNESPEDVMTSVEKAGIARRVTIATRRMGRGVDFKSNDSAVEAKGGVHVIQTFWSEDVKEETQIKGRTARQDNSGSYETILCREHITKAGYETSICSYNELNAAREKRAQEKGTELEKNIQVSQQKHEATLDFLRSFFNYNPKHRNEFFQKYPFVDDTDN